MRPGVRDRVQTESLLLALAAGAAGALLAHWLQPLLVALTPAAVGAALRVECIFTY